MTPNGGSKPRIVFLMDRPQWAFDINAQAIIARLSDRYEFGRHFVHIEKPDLRPETFDLLFVCFWGEKVYQSFDIPPHKIIKQVASHRWENEEKYGLLTARQFVERDLSDCGLVTTVSQRLYDAVSTHRQRVYHCPTGVELKTFRMRRRRRGPMRVGWAGNVNDACKGLHDILIPACEGRFEFEYSPGNWNRRQMARFYNRIDVLVVGSTAEGEPLPLMEAMACGCFAVTVDVGIVPELVVNGQNGLVVERSIEGFRKGLQWCEQNLERIRQIGPVNAAAISLMRPWDRWALRMGEVFEVALGRKPAAQVPQEVPAEVDRVLRHCQQAEDMPPAPGWRGWMKSAVGTGRRRP